jgi:hypothetical protein
MAQLTAFTASLDPPVRRRLVAEAVGELGGHPPLVRRVVFTAIR